MPIAFKCTNCQKPLRVKDELAGRKISCPGCKAVVRAPKAAAVESGAAGPAGDVDHEALALAAIAERMAADAPPDLGTVDFVCPQCDAELKLSADLAGKQAPCPECKRIIKVPLLKKKSPVDWRQSGPQIGPTKEILKDQEVLDDSWSTSSASKVSSEALFRAGAIKVQKPRLTKIQWAQRIGYGVAALAFLGLGWWFLSRMLRGNLEAELRHGVEEYVAGPRAGTLNPEAQFELHRLLGAYWLEAARRPGAGEKKDGKLNFNMAMQLLTRTGPPLEKYLLAAELMETLQTSWPDPSTLAGALGDAIVRVPAGQLRWKLYRRWLAKRLSSVGDDAAAQESAYREAQAVLLKAMPSLPGAGPNAPRDFTDELGGLGVLGQELLRARRRDKAEEVWRSAQPKAKGMAKLPLPYLTLALMLDQPLPKEAGEYEGGLAKIAAAARRNRRSELQELLAKSGAASIEDALLRTEVAEVFAGEANEIAAAQLTKALEIVQPHKAEASDFARWELCRVSLQAEGPEAAARRAERLLQGQLLARFLYLAYRQKLEADPKLNNPAAADDVKPEGAASSLAKHEAARRMAATDPAAAQKWANDLPREADVPFARLGVLQALLDKKQK